MIKKKFKKMKTEKEKTQAKFFQCLSTKIKTILQK